MSEFKIGMVVKLKSGGPEMTISRLETDFDIGPKMDTVTCQWFAGKKLERGIFPVESLIVIDEKNS